MTTPFKSRQMTMTLILIAVIKVFHVFPRSVAQEVATAGWWALLLAGGMALLLLWPTAAYLARTPRGSLGKLAVQGGGTPLAIAVALVIGATVLTQVGLVLRQVSEIASTVLFPHTPQTFVMTGSVVGAALAAAMSTSGLLWLGASFAPIVLAGVTAILAGNMGWGKLLWLTPVAGHGILPSLGSSVFLISYYGEAVFLAMAAQDVLDRRELVRSAAVTVGVSALVFAAVQVVYGTVFPYPGGLAIPFPFFEMTRLAQGGRFLERVDAFWTFIWVIGSTLRSGIALHGVTLLYAEVFRLPDPRGAVLPLSVVTVAIALLPSNVATALEWDSTFGHYRFLILLVLPLLMIALARLRKRANHAR